MNTRASAFHIGLIIILVLVFFGVIFLSSAESGVDSQIEFKDSIPLSEDLREHSQFEIGTLTITNNGPLTKRVDVPQYVTCHFRDNREPLSFDVSLQGVRTTAGDSSEPFGNSYYYQRYIDVKSQQAVSGNFVISLRYPYVPQESQQDIYDSTNPNIHVFELEQGENVYDACLTKNQDEAYHTIQVVME